VAEIIDSCNKTHDNKKHTVLFNQYPTFSNTSCETRAQTSENIFLVIPRLIYGYNNTCANDNMVVKKNIIIWQSQVQFCGVIKS
jgi:hypothetical protein